MNTSKIATFFLCGTMSLVTFAESVNLLLDDGEYGRYIDDYPPTYMEAGYKSELRREGDSLRVEGTKISGSIFQGAWIPAPTKLNIEIPYRSPQRPGQYESVTGTASLNFADESVCTAKLNCTYSYFTHGDVLPNEGYRQLICTVAKDLKCSNERHFEYTKIRRLRFYTSYKGEAGRTQIPDVPHDDEGSTVTPVDSRRDADDHPDLHS